MPLAVLITSRKHYSSNRVVIVDQAAAPMFRRVYPNRTFTVYGRSGNFESFSTADCVPRLRHWSDKGLVLFAGQTLWPLLQWPDERTSLFER
jgi:hypothetical protein